MSAAHGARQKGARVVVADVAPASWSGGNSYFSAGAFRTAHPGLPGVESILDGVDRDLLARTHLELAQVGRISGEQVGGVPPTERIAHRDAADHSPVLLILVFECSQARAEFVPQVAVGRY